MSFTVLAHVGQVCVCHSYFILLLARSIYLGYDLALVSLRHVVYVSSIRCSLHSIRRTGVSVTSVFLAHADEKPICRLQF